MREGCDEPECIHPSRRSINNIKKSNLNHAHQADQVVTVSTSHSHQLVAAYGDLSRSLSATHQAVVTFQVALSGASPEEAAKLMADMPKMPYFEVATDTKNGKKVSLQFRTFPPIAHRRNASPAPSG